jgi:hypothetical protein
LNDLGTLLVERNKLDEAEPMLLRSLEIRRKLLGEEHLEIVKSLTSLGRLNSEKGKFADGGVVSAVVGITAQIAGGRTPRYGD